MHTFGRLYRRYVSPGQGTTFMDQLFGSEPSVGPFARPNPQMAVVEGKEKDIAPDDRHEDREGPNQPGLDREAGVDAAMTFSDDWDAARLCCPDEGPSIHIPTKMSDITIDSTEIEAFFHGLPTQGQHRSTTNEGSHMADQGPRGGRPMS